MSLSKIEWTDRTWNPVRGCSRVSEGCRFCYAERLAARFSTHANQEGDEPGGAFAGFAETRNGEPRWTGRVELLPSKLDEPLRWKKPARVFVNSMSDLFHEKLSDAAILDVFRVMKRATQHTFQILTKRPARMLNFMRRLGQEDGVLFLDHLMGGMSPHLDHVWLGVSVEDQATADERIPLLLQTPAAVRFVSYEPALGPVNFHNFLKPCWGHEVGHEPSGPEDPGYHYEECEGCAPTLDWIIVGGESGPGARPFDFRWARQTLRDCKAAGVSVFVKQLGARPVSVNLGPSRDPDVAGPFPIRDRKGGDPSEWPPDLRVREFPR